MCMVVYIASKSPLPLIPWHKDSPALNVTELTSREEPVRDYLTLPHVCQVGSHTCCGCGFNEGREHPEACEDPADERADALRSAAQLADYIRMHGVEQLYACWSGDECQPKNFERLVTPETLMACDFFFRPRELLIVNRAGA